MLDEVRADVGERQGQGLPTSAVEAGHRAGRAEAANWTLGISNAEAAGPRQTKTRATYQFWGGLGAGQW